MRNIDQMIKPTTKSALSAVSMLFCLTIGIAQAYADEVVTIPVPKGETLCVRTPMGWHLTVTQPSSDIPPTVKCENNDSSVSVVFTLLADSENRFTARESVDLAVTKSNQHYVPTSIEKQVTLTQIVSTNGHGSYACFTDAALATVSRPGKGEFRNVASGLFVIKRNLVSFTVLSNDPRSAEYRHALQIICDGIFIR
jgi:hypothetical protein